MIYQNMWTVWYNLLLFSCLVDDNYLDIRAKNLRVIEISKCRHFCINYLSIDFKRILLAAF